MAITPRFGFNWFNSQTEGDLTEDGQKYTGADRLMLDSILAALEKHDHRVTSTVAAPTDEPTLTHDTGGSLDGGTEYFYVISFITDDGLETVTGPEVSHATPEVLPTPDAPSAETALAADYPASMLSEGVYHYAVTALRAGEESAISDFEIATVLEDENTVILTLPDLNEATSFQIWRMKETDAQWTRIGTTDQETFTDDGSVPPAAFGDPANTPPEDTEGADDYLITINLSGDDLARVQAGDVAAWRIYRTTVSGTYSAASLVHEVVERSGADTDTTAPLLTSWVDDGDEPLTGSPRTTSTQLSVTPYTFEKAATLPPATGYPVNYPLLVGDTLHYNKNGTWTPLSGASSGGGGDGGGEAGSIDFQGPWQAGTYQAGALVTYANGLWMANADSTTVPGSQAGGNPLTLSTNGENYGQSVQGNDMLVQAVGQKFRNEAAMDVTSVQLYFDGTQSAGRTLIVTFGLSASISQLHFDVAYSGTIPSGTGWKSFALARPFALPADTDVWLYAGGWYSGNSDPVVPGTGLCLQGSQSSGLTFTGPSYAFQPPGYDTLVENAANDGGKMLAFKLVGTDAPVNHWDQLASLIPATGDDDTVLTKTGPGAGDYTWNPPASGGGSGGGTGASFLRLDSSLVFTDPGTSRIWMETIPIAGGETWEIEATLTYQPGYGNIEWYLSADFENPTSAAIGYNAGELWYPGTDGATSVKHVYGAAAIGTGESDGGPAVQVSDGYTMPVKLRYVVTNPGNQNLTVGATVALIIVSVIDPGASVTIGADSYLRATRIA